MKETYWYTVFEIEHWWWCYNMHCGSGDSSDHPCTYQRICAEAFNCA